MEFQHQALLKKENMQMPESTMKNIQHVTFNKVRIQCNVYIVQTLGQPYKRFITLNEW